MPNRNYRNGADKERRIAKAFRDQGHLAIRSAGSHTEVDVVVFKKTEGEILLIQCKPKSMSMNKKLEILHELQKYEGTYKVRAIVQ